MLLLPLLHGGAHSLALCNCGTTAARPPPLWRQHLWWHCISIFRWLRCGLRENHEVQIMHLTMQINNNTK